MSVPAQQMIDDFYEEERDVEVQKYVESKQQAFTIRVDARTVAILEGISKRFGKSRNAIASEILWRDAEIMWDSLEQDDRFIVAEYGDAFLAKLDADTKTLLTRKEREILQAKLEGEQQEELEL